MKALSGRTSIELLEGDITELDIDAIVNAANESLILGGGVAGAIREKGGDSIQEECSAIGGTTVGGAVVTTGGNLKARFVIHAVGPRMGEGDEDRKLSDATLNSLIRADENNLTGIAFPAVSTGIFGFPADRAARVMLETVKDYVTRPTGLDRVVFCLYGQDAYNTFAAEFKKQFDSEITEDNLHDH